MPRTVNNGACECCDATCCLQDMIDADGVCFTFAPAVNDFDPTAGDPFRFRTYFQEYAGHLSEVSGRHFVLVLSGKTTVEGKESCYYLEFPCWIFCDGSGNLKVRVRPPEFISVIANDTYRIIVGLTEICDPGGVPGDTDAITFDCTAGTWATGELATVTFDWTDPRDAANYTTSMTWTVYVGAPGAGPACPAFPGSIDPPNTILEPFDCTSAGGTPFGLFKVELNDGTIDADDVFQWGNSGTDCAFDFDTDPPDDWSSGQPPGPLDPTNVVCNDVPMSRVIPFTLGGGTGDCNCLDGAVGYFVWFPTDTDGHGYYGSTLIRRCGHSIHFLLTCVDSGGLPTWFLDVFVDGVSTGLIAWDLQPGNDVDNPNHFELHADFFGDICRGRIFLVAG